MKRTTLVPCDDPLAAFAVAGPPPTKAPAPAPKKPVEKKKSSTKREPITTTDFGDAAWLQSEFIRPPMPKKERKTKPKPPPPDHPSPEAKSRVSEIVRPRSPGHKRKNRDYSLEGQLNDDVVIGPDGDIIPLPGEDEQMRLEDEVSWPNTAGLVEVKGLDPAINPSERIKLRSSKGSFVTTNYRLYYLRKKSKDKWKLDPLTHIPLGEIDRVEMKENRYRRKGPVMWLELGCKGVRVVRFGFMKESLCERALRLISAFTFADLELSFSFQYKLHDAFKLPFDGWSLYDAKAEYRRLGLPNSTLRLSEANMEYKLCSTYPREFVVPSSISDEDLESIAKFRSRGRIPVLVWHDRVTGATIWRCSQPRVGLQYARNKSDEELLDKVSELNGRKKLIIYDARPLKNALANKAVGKGYEESSYYRNTEIRFMNIENIHRVRESYNHARKATLECGQEWDGRFHARFESSGWLKHIRTILKATYEMTARVNMCGASIVSHCSDGWDRTAQLIASTEMCLDPYFRTIKGFFCLIEKEWLSFGHQFYKRVGHMKPVGDQDISPIFIQWLDMVWQITRQFPTAFEFNSRMLCAIAYHTTSLRFGTFLYDCDRERREKKIRKHTVSLWSYLIASPAARRGDFTNPLYDRQKDGVIYPSWGNAYVGVWSDYWLMHCHSPIRLTVAKDKLPPGTLHVDQLPKRPQDLSGCENLVHGLRKELRDQKIKAQLAERRIEEMNREMERLKSELREMNGPEKKELDMDDDGAIAADADADADAGADAQPNPIASTEEEGFVAVDINDAAAPETETETETEMLPADTIKHAVDMDDHDDDTKLNATEEEAALKTEDDAGGGAAEGQLQQHEQQQKQNDDKSRDDVQVSEDGDVLA